jgi:hypothetical protein
MFPHLVAGPIVRYADLAPQFARLGRRPDRALWALGIWFLVVGMAKKVLLADPIAAHIVTPLWSRIPLLDTLEAWVALLGYNPAALLRFLGLFSDMALGLAAAASASACRQNFDARPIRRPASADFWRRWHMTLLALLAAATTSTSRWAATGSTGRLRTLRQPGADHAARRPLARRRLDLRAVGPLPRGLLLALTHLLAGFRERRRARRARRARSRWPLTFLAGARSAGCSSAPPTFRRPGCCSCASVGSVRRARGGNVDLLGVPTVVALLSVGCAIAWWVPDPLALAPATRAARGRPRSPWCSCSPSCASRRRAPSSTSSSRTRRPARPKPAPGPRP